MITHIPLPELPLGKGAAIALRDEGEIVGGFPPGGSLSSAATAMITTVAVLLVCGSSSIVYLATWLRAGRLALHLRGIARRGDFWGLG